MSRAHEDHQEAPDQGRREKWAKGMRGIMAELGYLALPFSRQVAIGSTWTIQPGVDEGFGKCRIVKRIDEATMRRGNNAGRVACGSAPDNWLEWWRWADKECAYFYQVEIIPSDATQWSEPAT